VLGFREQVLCQLRRVQEAAEVSDITVLLEGETETGKLVLARSILQLDQKRNWSPIVSVHCNTISEAG
jgi:transcriptional regulator with PAS, ATPase and Fis domain